MYAAKGTSDARSVRDPIPAGDVRRLSRHQNNLGTSRDRWGCLPQRAKLIDLGFAPTVIGLPGTGVSVPSAAIVNS